VTVVRNDECVWDCELLEEGWRHRSEVVFSEACYHETSRRLAAGEQVPVLPPSEMRHGCELNEIRADGVNVGLLWAQPDENGERVFEITVLMRPASARPSRLLPDALEASIAQQSGRVLEALVHADNRACSYLSAVLRSKGFSEVGQVDLPRLATVYRMDVSEVTLGKARTRALMRGLDVGS
jgi:hypothetical protein